MRRNRKNNIKKERVIMIASSAFVLAALTMTGVYMKDRNVESKDDGYSVDLAALEGSQGDNYPEIAQNNTTDTQKNQVAQGDTTQGGTTVAQGDTTQEGTTVAQGDTTQGGTTVAQGDATQGGTTVAQGDTTQGGTTVAQGDALDGEKKQANMDDDLDYMPLEAGSSLVEIAGLTEGAYSLLEQEAALEGISDFENIVEDDEVLAEIENNDAADSDNEENADEEASAQDVVVSKELHFVEENGLIRPTTGEILMNYSMDSSIYFATLDQYKYNPAVMFSAEEGSVVSACAEGKVVDIYEDAQIGNAVTIDLGDGYQATYGQLQDIQVSVDSYVNAGDEIGSVAAPTKYFSVEGSNLYFQLTKDGAPVNPESLF